MKHIDQPREGTNSWAPRLDPNYTAWNGLIECSFDLPFGYRATFVWRPDEPFEVRWSPDQPRTWKPRPRRKILAAYQPARREFFEEVGTVIGGMMLVVVTDLKSAR